MENFIENKKQEVINDNEELECAENLDYKEDTSINIYPANIKIEQERYSV